MVQKKRVWGWFFYDWACQPYYTLMLTFIFSPYFATVASQYFITQGVDDEIARADAQYYWSLTLTITGLFVGVIAPILGSIADTSGRRIPWIYCFSALLVIGSFGLWFGMPDGSNWVWILVAFGIGFVGAEFALIFTNAQLPSLGSEKEIGALSGSGFAFGYLGGLISLIFVLVFLLEQENGKTLLGLDPILGLDANEKEGTRFVGPFVGIWFIIFSVPYFKWVKDSPSYEMPINVQKGLSDLFQTIKSLLHERSTAFYLGSSMFYRDSLNGLYGFGGVYATLVLDWTIVQIGTFGIIAALAAAVFSWLGGKWDRRFGPKPVIIFSILILILVCITIVLMTREAFFGIPIAAGSTFPDIVFYICGVIIGGFGGILQSASRTMMVRHTTPDNATRYFGLYGLSGRATAFLAPSLIAIVTAATNSVRIGVSPLIGLFIVGLLLLFFVHPNGEQRNAVNS